MVTNIIDKFVEIAQSSSDRHAIYNQDDVYTYGQLLTAAQAVALNVQQNTDCKRVGLLAPTAADFARRSLAWTAEL